MGPTLELGHLGLCEFDCELVIVVSELSFGECGKKKTSESPHFPFTSILNTNFGYLIMDACCLLVLIN